ncbi:hypothetical protein CesoFtcFv8_002808 [Champsocephalus esox]|uniref:Uncharacterized protein n=1 Tax=Champsocephalus esox TaxID=159716 RepID=A0AAN8HF08_9TELE|nr:hypothetical protein CesoFtcFv8_002808 [Champsocephalus esox]
MAFAWQLGRPSIPPPSLAVLLLHSSTPDIKGGQGREGGRGPLLGGGWTTQSSTGQDGPQGPRITPLPYS